MRAAEPRVHGRADIGELVGRRFAHVERRDVDGWVTIHDGETVGGFVASLDLETQPELEPYELPLRSRRASSVFVATKAA